MALEETNKLDAMGTNEDGTELLLLLTDAHDWSDETTHLLLLQDKINAYIGFIETKQYEESHPNAKPRKFIILVKCMYELPLNAKNFFNTVEKQLNPHNIIIDLEITGN